MTCIINASTSNGLISTADTSGQLAIQANGSTVATAQSTGLNLASTGLVFSDSSVQTSGKGAAKAWVNFVGGSTPTVNQSFNVTSVTYVSAGNWQVNFTTAFSNTSYCPIVGTANNSVANTGNTIAVVNSTSQVSVAHFEAGSQVNLGGNAYLACFGN